MAIETTEQKQFIIRKNSAIRSNSRNAPIAPKISFANQEEQEIEQDYEKLTQIEGTLRVIQNKFNKSEKLFSDYFEYQDDSNKYREIGQNILEKDQTLKPYFLQRLQADEQKRQEQEQLEKQRALKKKTSLHTSPVSQKKQQMIKSDPVIPQFQKALNNQRYNSVNRVRISAQQQPKKINLRNNNNRQSMDIIPPIQQVNQYQNIVNNKLMRKPIKLINFKQQNNMKQQQQQVNRI